jgi:putative CocE/NonD family hydrolase
MKINYKHIGYSPKSITRYLSSFILLFLLSACCEAQVSQEKFMTPHALTKAKINNSEEALTLLTSDTFHQELADLAKELSTNHIEQAGMFNKVALLSILEKHQQLKQVITQHKNAISYTHYTLHSETIVKLSKVKLSKEKKKNPKQALFIKTLTDDLSSAFAKMSDEDLYQMSNALGWSVTNAQDYAFNIFRQHQEKSELSSDEAIQLIVNSHLYRVLERVIPISQKIINNENEKRYIIIPETLITTAEGVELAATIVRKKGAIAKLPTAFQFTIYAEESYHIKTAIHAAVHGYIGVVANSRGKRSSSNTITPWVYEGQDATSVIDWISKQPWSNGKVAMYGGSYNGFTQWAAAKHMHPALKAIAPYTAASLITGLPYENNIALTGNYQWAHHVTNNKTMDNSVYANWQKSNDLLTSLYESGRALKDIAQLDGKPNPFFEEWLDHPSFDEYYQAMVPFQAEYANINIPVLSVTGYFDGGQISAIDYMKRHYKYNKNADHTLLIGPYDHRTSQGTPRSHYSNYQLDDIALEKDTEEIVFEWLNHVLANGPKPHLLKDKVNYQLMGSNTWQHHSSFEEMNEQSTIFYLRTQAEEDDKFNLSSTQENDLAFVQQTVDMTDRSTQHNQAPWPVIQNELKEDNGLIYVTSAFETEQALAGAISGYFSIAVNKKDVDIGYNFYEIDKDGQAFHLNNYRSRASYAENMSKRQLLIPNQKTIVPIINARMTAKLIKKGSRLAIVLNVNKNVDAQVNMGSGKNVSLESIADAGEPLTIKWFNDSVIKLPLKTWQP